MLQVFSFEFLNLRILYILIFNHVTLLQDAHELFNVLTSTLDEESLKFPSTLSLFDLHSLEVCSVPIYTVNLS